MQVSIEPIVCCKLGGVIIFKYVCMTKIQADNTKVETIELKRTVF